MSLRKIFEQHEKCFIPFVTAGHPDLESTREIVLELARVGAHIVEIGIPFSDPIADGPIIQRSSFGALRHGYTMSDYLQLVRDIRAHSGVGLLFMTYLNPVLRFGLERLDREGPDAGLDGLLISDLTPEDYLCALCVNSVSSVGHPSLTNLETVFLVAPTSSEERIKRACQVSTGFVYLVARTGVTGKQTEFGNSFLSTVDRIRNHTDLPVAAGFGIRSAADVAGVWEHVDGAIIGSAIVEFIENHRNQPDLAQRVGTFVNDTLLP